MEAKLMKSCPFCHEAIVPVKPDMVTEIDVRLRDIRGALAKNQLVLADRIAQEVQNLVSQLSELSWHS